MSTIAMLIGPGFEDSEVREPLTALRGAGHHVALIGAEAREHLRGKRGDDEIETDLAARDSTVEDYDALVIPGGFGPDRLRLDPGAVTLARAFAESDKPIAAICHGPQLLIEADAVRGRRLTSWPSVRLDLINAGAQWVDEQVVQDGNLITSRQPADLEAFNETLLTELAHRGGDDGDDN